MKPDDFIRKFQMLFPDCKPDAAQNWQTFAVECVDQHQYVHFKAAKSRDACIEDWLGILYEGLRQTKDRFGTAVSTQVADLSCEPCCLYPGEMPQAAECLRDGGNAEEIWRRIDSGEIDCTDLFSAAPQQQTPSSQQPARHRKLPSR